MFIVFIQFVYFIRLVVVCMYWIMYIFGCRWDNWIEIGVMREISIDDSFKYSVITSLAICMTTLHFTILKTAI
jgi:hypothetical protein